MEMSVKLCSHCRQTLPQTFFHRDRTKSDGLSSTCKACRKASDSKRQRSTYYAKRRRKRTAKGLCPNHGKPKPCLSCSTYQRTYQAVYRETNKERFPAYREKYKQRLDARLKALRNQAKLVPRHDDPVTHLDPPCQPLFCTA
jgi:hypothetical protein